MGIGCISDTEDQPLIIKSHLGTFAIVTIDRINNLDQLVDEDSLVKYAVADSEEYHTMVDRIRNRLNLTSLKYQTLPGFVNAIGLPKDKVCTYCWDGNG